MGETDWGGNWVLFWWAGPCSVNLESNFLLMGGAVFPPAIYLGPNYDGGDEDNGGLPQKTPGMYCYSLCPQPCSRLPPTHTSTGDSWTLTGKSGQSLVGSALLSPGSWCTRFCLCLPRVYFPVLCKFWQLCGGVNGGLLQEGLYHTQVCCTQSPCPCGRPPLTQTSAGDAQTQFCLSLCGPPGSWCTQGLFEPSEHLWREWGLILNMNSPLLPSRWGFSFALGCGVSLHSRSGTYRLTGAPLT